MSATSCSKGTSATAGTQVTYRSIPNFPYYDHNDGLLVLSATVDGVPCDGTIEIASGPNTLYYPFAWQPTP